ncbi:MAG: NADH-quinone oxidoreductase subunit J [Thermoplasmata archaeon]|nr:NADH-quinone oxidoreductase subunit J [Thermoplasmata archaeon]
MSDGKYVKSIAVLALVFLMLFIITQASFDSDSPQETEMTDLGISLFEDHYLPFVLLSLVLVAAMLGSVFIAKERDE